MIINGMFELWPLEQGARLRALPLRLRWPRGSRSCSGLIQSKRTESRGFWRWQANRTRQRIAVRPKRNHEPAESVRSVVP